jgi:hypothetical protein
MAFKPIPNVLNLKVKGIPRCKNKDQIEGSNKIKDKNQ